MEGEAVAVALLVVIPARDLLLAVAVAVALLVVIPEGNLLLAVVVVVVVVPEIGPGFIPDIQPATRMGFSPRDMFSLLDG